METISLLISSLLSCFVEKKYFHGSVGTYEIRELPQHNILGFFRGERSLKIHIEIKRELFMFYCWSFPSRTLPNIKS
jgi:hypothetical protein